MAGLAAEWIKIPDGNGGLTKVWLRDSQARRDIAQLQTDVSGKADAATTLAGYGITDAYTKAQVDGMIPSVPSAYTSNPSMDGTASPGSSTAWARGDHVHPHDSTKADMSAIPTKTSDLTNDSGFITSAPVTSVNGQTGAVSISVPTKTSDLTNDSGFLTSAPVASVNGQTGAVSLTASDVGALPSSTAIPSKTSDLTNDSGFITAGKFAVVDGTLPSAGGFGTEMSYPTGFTSTNCVILSVSAYVFSEWRGGVGIVAASERLWCDLTATGIKPFISANSAFYGATVRVVLMRTDI